MRFDRKFNLLQAAFFKRLLRAGPTKLYERSIGALGSKQQPAQGTMTSTKAETSFASPASLHWNEGRSEWKTDVLQVVVMEGGKCNRVADIFPTPNQAYEANTIRHADGVVTVWSHLW